MRILHDCLCRLAGTIGLCGLSVSGFSAEEPDTLSLLFVGDLMQHQAQLDAARREDGSYDYACCFEEVATEIQHADIAVGNLEVPLGGKPYTGYPAFSAPDEWAIALRDAGFDVLLTANNHCLDRRKKGLERTVFLLDSLQITHAGVYRNAEERSKRYPLLIEKDGFRIALLNYTYGTNGIEVSPPNIVNFIQREKIREDILAARRLKPDVLIACMHWGVEYNLLPEATDKELARWMIGLGVDHVIGSHPHVVQPIEVIDTLPDQESHAVVYSLGNFISNMSKLHTDGGLAVKLTLQKAYGITRLVDCAYAFVWTSRPALSGNNKFIVYPAGKENHSLTPAEQARMDLFLRNARQLFRQYSSGAEEYFFERK